MPSYEAFAAYYDRLTADIDYPARAAYFDRILISHGGNRGILLDLGCGTGSLCEAMAALGYDMIGADSSEEMLTVAMNKKYASGQDILYLCQPMQSLALYSSIDACVCALDSINHLTRARDVQKTFARVARYLEPGGLFLFDVNTLYKHENVLAGNTFVYDYDEIYCVWQNSECVNGRVDYKLDLFFPCSDGSYQRETEEFSEQAYSPDEISGFLADAGMKILECYAGDTFDAPGPKTERLVYLAQKY